MFRGPINGPFPSSFRVFSGFREGEPNREVVPLDVLDPVIDSQDFLRLNSGNPGSTVRLYFRLFRPIFVTLQSEKPTAQHRGSFSTIFAPVGS